MEQIIMLVSSPDLISRAILKAIRAGVGFGSGTETTNMHSRVHGIIRLHRHKKNKDKMNYL